MTSTILIKNGVVIDTEPEPVVLGRADVRVDGDTITAVGPDLPAEPGAEVIDATGRLVLPGFVDTHRHTWQAGIRAVAPDIDFGGYMRRIMTELAPRHRPRDLHAGNLAGALECLDAGVTTLLDWSHAQYSPEHTEAAVRALRESGIRAVFGYCHAGRHGVLAEETRRVHDTHFGTPGLVTMAVAALGPEITSEEHALAEWRVAAELGLPVTAHLGGRGRQSAVKGLAFLEDHGLLATPTTFVHALYYTDEELKRLAAAGATASIAPVDEMNLGIGYPTTGDLRAAGIPTGLGADTVVCSPGDMFSQMRTAHLLERGRPGGAGLGFTTRDALRMATIEGAQVLGLGDVVGSLRPGKQADLQLLRTDTLGMAAAHDPIGAIVLNADTGCVDTVMVAGRVLKSRGQILHHDLAAVLASLAESAGAVVAV
ncbi:cytosine/adenosine deaminase-related metal-dependent hydrolase [Nonomuraea thailandensis]|uniref:Cytosine/adenosine deaminase-related metal-dependent hydrolase n=1 Tax=Nonomuraea thailandensis TaxID=1188745 RepID=A0A9X2GQF7_9ACTN|nr:amidohydrolase family protein [Nonomuraea thailandensis]MCP2362030.1 cytosine/adenosine deaminase-related metal-dependent hydrolase [Nonomuraea thailandensis]